MFFLNVVLSLFLLPLYPKTINSLLRPLNLPQPNLIKLTTGLKPAWLV